MALSLVCAGMSQKEMKNDFFKRERERNPFKIKITMNLRSKQQLESTMREDTQSVSQ